MSPPRARLAIRPTPRLAWLFALSAPLAALLVSGFGSPSTWALAYPAMCLLLGALDLLLRLGLKVRMSFDFPRTLPLGREGRIAVRLDAGALGAPVLAEAAIELAGPLADTPVHRVSGPMTPAGLELFFPVRPARRGRLILRALWLRWSGPLGLCRFQVVWPLGESAIESVQDVGGIHGEALSFFQREASLGQKSQPFRGEGSEFDSLMEYSQGMDNRLIDWKRSARHHRLLAKDFRQERNHHIILAFDTGRLMREPVMGLTRLDHYVRAALLMAWVGIRSGDMVGAADFALNFNAFLKPGQGATHFSRLQRFTAALGYGGDETNFAASLAELKNRTPHRSLVVVFTEFIDVISAEFLVEGLGFLARRHTVVFVSTPDPVLAGLRDRAPSSLEDLAGSVISDGFARDRAIVLERVARLGIQAIDVPPAALGAAVLNRYLAIKQRGIL
ncbi:MAG: DUF58 domain-containing protein [Deltaproteobacteria bacterium]|nr:DUF58 domain-containing protein [Deltaproteobacteria bacterium]